MGVTGLWKLLEGNGRSVALEYMEGKVLAVDISIWLNMAVKGMRDNHGHSSQNAHLITLFNRICKLLYFGIKPVFVFDGKAPLLKQNTLRERRRRKEVNVKKTKVASEKMMQNYLKKQVLQMALKINKEKQPSTSKEPSSIEESFLDQRRVVGDFHQEEEDMFHLPPLKDSYVNEEVEKEWEERTLNREAVFGAAFSGDFKELLAIDVNSDDFKLMPVEIQHELLTDIKEIHKRRRTLVEKMPEKSDSFSSFQLSGILAKRGLSKKIDNIEKKMSEVNTSTSFLPFGEFDGDSFKSQSVVANKISSEESTHYILIKKPKENAKTLENVEDEPIPEKKDEKFFSNTQTLTSNNNSSESLPTANSNLNVIETEDTESTLLVSNQQNETQQKIVSVESKPNVLESFLKKVVQQKNVDETKSSVDQQNVLNNQKSISETANLQPQIPKTETPSSDSKTINMLTTNGNNTDTLLYQENGDATKIDLTNESPIKLQATKLNDVQHEIIDNNKIQTNKTTITNATSLLPTNDNNLNNINKNDTDVVSVTTEIPTSPINTEEIESDNNNKVIKLEVSDSESDNDFEEVKVENEEIKLSLEVQITSDNDLPEIQPNNPTQENKEENIETPAPNPFLDLNEEDLMIMEQDIDTEDLELLKRIRVASRAAKEVTNQATSECQELLQLFGIPFVISPEEAEAQCAFLDLHNLTMGTITEDSDIWLFGGKVVYKDFFDRKRDPTCYDYNDIKLDMGLDRNHFINIALCSGSDYTAGIEDVGPVRALEIMKEFPGQGIESLIQFKEWWDLAHAQVKPPKSETKIKGHLRKISVSKNFPSQHVVEAYLNPRVNESKDKFSWGLPDLDALREFAIERLKWTKKKVDEDLLPILKKNAEREKQKQTFMTNYLKRPQILNTKIVSKKSKRVQRAIRPLLLSPEQPNTNKKPKKIKKAPLGRGRKKRGGKMVPVIPKVENSSPIVELKLSESSSDSN